MKQDCIDGSENAARPTDGRQNLSSRNLCRSVITATVNKITEMIFHAPLEVELKELYCKKLSALASDESLLMIYLSCNSKVTPMDLKYLLCFYIDMSVKDISLTFNVEVASIYTVRYRIRKKFKDNLAFQFLM